MSFGATRPFTCADVRACLELEYTTYTEATFSPVNDSTITNQYIVRIDDQNDIVYISDIYGGILQILDLSDGSLTTLITNFIVSFASAHVYTGNMHASLNRKYYVGADIDTTPHTLKIFKNGAVILSWQFPLSSSSWAVAVSHTGKWIIVIDDTNNKYYIFEGS